MPEKSRLLEEIIALSSEVEDLKESFSEEVETYPQRRRIARAERVQAAIAIAMITIYFTLRSNNGSVIKIAPTECIFSNFHPQCAIGIQVLLASIFLLLKSGVMTTRPLYSEGQDGSERIERWLQNIDEYWLPALFVPMFLFGVVSGVIYLLVPGTAFLELPGIPIFSTGIVIYIALEIIVFYTLGRAFAGRYDAAMGQLHTSNKGRTISVSRGPRGSTSEIFLDNQSDSPVDDIYFRVSSPDNVEVTLGQAYEEDGKWIYTSTVPPNPDPKKRIPLNIQTSGQPDTSEDESIPEIVVYTYQNGELVDEDIIPIR